MCTFVLVWLHGPNSGNLTAASIANICSIKTAAAKVDPDISSFVKLAKQRIEIFSSHCSSASRKPASCEVSCSFYNVKSSLLVFHRRVELQIAVVLNSKSKSCNLLV